MTVDAPRHRSSFHHMAPALMTADELLHSNIPDKRTELVRGVLVVREPAGYNHGRVTAQLTGRLWSHVERTAAGQLLGAETGFTLFRDPDTVRAPDIALCTATGCRIPQAAALWTWRPTSSWKSCHPTTAPAKPSPRSVTGSRQALGSCG